MKKIILPFILVLCLFLTACDTGEKRVSGVVTDAVIDENIGILSFTVKAGEEENITVYMIDETHISGIMNAVTAEEFKSGEKLNVAVIVEYDGNEENGYNANHIMITDYFADEFYTFADGTKAEIWSGIDETIYRLSDGIELIRIGKAMGPENVYSGGVQSFDDLNDTAKANVLAFYEKQGLMYDEDTEIEKAYAEYLACKESGDTFYCKYISQTIVPSASNEKIIAFTTETMLPLDNGNGYTHRIGAVFDKETGEVIGNTALFSCAPEELAEKLLSEEYLADKDMKAEFLAAFKPEYIQLLPELMHIDFPPGTLASAEHTYILAYNYENDLAGLINGWAIPE